MVHLSLIHNRSHEYHGIQRYQKRVHEQQKQIGDKMSIKDKINEIQKRVNNKELYRSNADERIRRELVRRYGKQKAKEVRIKDLD